MDNTLAHIDQASFLGFRALGHGPLIQLTWVYDHDVDLDGLRRFLLALGGGMLGRVVECSPLPFGRHRWVRWPAPTDLDVHPVRRPRGEIPEWIEERLRLPLDPETGPPWHLGVLPLTEGGAAVSLVVSHTVGDGVGISIAVADAARGITPGPVYPPPSSRTRWRALRDDARRFLRGLPEVFGAVAAAIRVARKSRSEVASSVRRSGAAPDLGAAEQLVTVPSATIFVDTRHWDERAESLGGTSNSLFLGLASRLGQTLGRLAADGSAVLAVPVSERTAGDLRGNALTGVTVTADPSIVTEDLSGIRSSVKAALSTLDQARYEMLAPLPLTPLVPRGVARRLEGLAMGDGTVIGCSNIGDLDPAANRPDGTDAEHFAIRSVESRTTHADLRRLGGVLFLMSARVNGQLSATVSYADPDGVVTRAGLLEVLRGLLAEFRLPGRVE